ncbi:hypothetical protein CsatB_002030 [Cannabis sativa]
MAIFTFRLITVILISYTVSSAIIESINDGVECLYDGGSPLVSKGASFELGFFSPGSSNNKNRYLGIWYKNIPVRTVVWVANRCSPIKDSSGMLKINKSNGNLMLLGVNKSVVWSTSLLKQTQQTKLHLLDNGDLVLRDEISNTILWRSFDYPSDTLLPDMKLGWDLRTVLNRRLSAWKNFEDPCPGDFTYGIELNQKLHNFPEFCMRKGFAKFYRSGPWNGIGTSGAPELKLNSLFYYNFVLTDDEVYYVYGMKNKSAISRIVINQTTLVRERLIWIEEKQTWKRYLSVPRDDCDNYGVCGVNGNCVIGDNPICHCLKGFKPKFQEKWNEMDWSDGCMRNVPLNCKDRNRDGFLKISGVKLPDTSDSWWNKQMNLKDCKGRCLNNCSCMAYSNSDIRGEGSGCVIWFGDLIDIRQFSSGGQGQDLHIRMPHSELSKSKRKVGAIWIVVAAIGVVFLLGYCIYKRRAVKDGSETTNQNGEEDDDLDLPLFNLSTVSTATDNFSENNKLGEGGFGPVYRGILEDRQEIAVKRLSMSSGQGVNEFKNEVKLIVKLQHRNLVKLLGCCIQGEEKLLVYEYMPNKSLDFFIFDQVQGQLLDWTKRFQIICGISRGLLYLHHDSRLRIIHRDLKASNVLLDNEMNPKISDFGLARIVGGDQIEHKTNRVIGTYGYMAPEYAFDGLFSIKSDVFSFGILVLEIVSGRKSRGFHCEKNGLTLIGHAWTLMKEERAYDLVDEWLLDENLDQVLRCIHISLLCVQHNPADRPTMSSVVLMFGSQNELPQPKAPGYFMEPDYAKGDNSSSNNHELLSTNEMSISLIEAR